MAKNHLSFKGQFVRRQTTVEQFSAPLRLWLLALFFVAFSEGVLAAAMKNKCEARLEPLSATFADELLSSLKPDDTIESIVARWPEELRANVTAHFYSESVHHKVTSILSPRLIHFSPLHQAIVAVSGAVEGPGSQVMEIIQYNAGQFEFHEIAPGPDGRLRAIRNSARCNSCHQGLPIWRPYFDWEATFGGQHQAEPLHASLLDNLLAEISRHPKSAKAQRLRPLQAALAGFDMNRTYPLNEKINSMTQMLNRLQTDHALSQMRRELFKSRRNFELLVMAATREGAVSFRTFLQKHLPQEVAAFDRMVEATKAANDEVTDRYRLNIRASLAAQGVKAWPNMLRPDFTLSEAAAKFVIERFFKADWPTRYNMNRFPRSGAALNTTAPKNHLWDELLLTAIFDNPRFIGRYKIKPREHLEYDVLWKLSEAIHRRGLSPE